MKWYLNVQHVPQSESKAYLDGRICQWRPLWRKQEMGVAHIKLISEFITEYYW